MNIVQVYWVKDYFDAGNIIRIKLYNEYEGVRNFKSYLNTKNGNKKIIEMYNRFFKKIGYEVTVIDVLTDFLVRDEISLKVETKMSLNELNCNNYLLFY